MYYVVGTIHEKTGIKVRLHAVDDKGNLVEKPEDHSAIEVTGILGIGPHKELVLAKTEAELPVPPTPPKTKSTKEKD